METIFMIRGAVQAGYKIDPKEGYGKKMLKSYNEHYRMRLEPLQDAISQNIHTYLVETRG